jgi:predicted Zn-dependent peptidase
VLSRRRLFGLALGGAAGAALRFPVGAAAQEQRDPIGRVTLANGLMVVAEERKSADTVAVRLTARAGGRDTADLPGLALLTSRVMLQGTPRYPSETSLQRAAALVGGTFERGTTTEYSAITAVVPSFEADVGFDLVSDVVKNAALDEGALGRQKSIALQDLAQRRASPSGLIDELFTSTLFAGHPLAAPLVGTADSINAINRGALLGARDRLWGASNLALAIVGNIPVDTALGKARQFFDGLPPGTRNEREARRVETRSFPNPVRGQAGQQQAQFRVGVPAPPQRDPDSYPFYLLNSITAGSSGLLFRELRGARGLAYSAGSAYLPYQDAGAWFATAGVDPQNLDAAIDVTRAVIAVLPTFRLTAGDIQGLVGQIDGLRALAEETNAARAERLAAEAILGIESTEELIRAVGSVTPGDVQRVAREYLRPERALTAIVTPPAGAAPAED